MENLSFMLLLVAFAVAFAFSVLHDMHMFQLNSYKPKVQLKWLKNNAKTLLPGASLTLACALLVFLVKDQAIVRLIAAVLFAATAVFKRPKKAKKPLVFTKRIIRLCVTIVIVTDAVVFASVLLASRFMPLIFAVCVLLSMFVMLLCNLINRPLEKGINRYYINDAKKMLKDHSRLITIGVTGSYGKTSVKYILGTLLEAKYNVLITPESFNTPLGVVKTVRTSLRATHDIFVCEMGAKNVGDIKEICDIVSPRHGVITSVGPQHLESFKSLDNVKKTKFELADALPANGLLFLNGEDDNIRDYSADKYQNAVRYGLTEANDYYADSIAVSSSGTTFTVHHGADSVPFTTSLLGRHNVINLVGAIAVCCELGIAMKQLQPYVRKVQGVEHRLQLTRKGAVTVIDDAYNSNPAGASAALDVLGLFSGCRVLVTPGMIELGVKQDEENKAFGAHAAKVCDYVVLVGKNQTKSIYDGLRQGGMAEEKIYVAADLTEAAQVAYAYDAAGQEKTLLFENDLPDNY